MKLSKKEWFCRVCWRSGLISGPLTIENARDCHREEVQRDINAERIPAGMPLASKDSPRMLRITGLDCVGDVAIWQPISLYEPQQPIQGAFSFAPEKQEARR